MQTTTLTAPGIVCAGCATSVQKVVSILPGVARVEVEVADKRVTVTHDDRTIRLTIEEALKKAGFLTA